MDVKNETFIPLFAEVKELLAPYAAKLMAHTDEPGYFDLWSEKDIEVDGRRRKEVFFCGLIIQKSYVGFYFMPLYADQERSLVFGPDLLARLEGKSCFHLEELTPELREQLRDALASGWRLYEERGWV